MNTLHKICVKIRRELSRGEVSSDDARMSLRFIASVVNQYRKKNIQIETDYGKIFSLLKYVEHDFDCLDLCDADKSECSEHLWGCTVKKICSPVTFLSLPDHRAVTYIGLIDKGHTFIYSEPSNIAVKRQTKLGKKFSFWYQIGDNIYVVPAEKYKYIETINLRGVPEDPSDVNDCINPDIDIEGKEVEYPILNANEADIVRFVLQELGMTLQLPVDESNNANAN